MKVSSRMGLVVFVAVVILLLLIPVKKKYFIYNVTESVPIGLYFVSHAKEIKRGDIVAFVPPREAQ